MEADERFYKRISEGYRMEKPLYAPSCVYDIMLECWAPEPTERPTFSALVDRIGDMMSEGLRNHYIDLNTEYMRINQTYMSGRPDFLSQMGGTDFSTSQRPSPERQYQNVPEEVDDSGYLKPIPFSPIPTGASTATGPQYQNVDMSAREQTVVAVNNGYQFVNRVSGPTEPRNDELDHPQSQVQNNFSSDFGELIGLEEDSASSNRNSGTDTERAVRDDKHVNIEIGSNGIGGIDNMNYVPNHMLFNNKTNSQPEQGKLVNGGNHTVENNRRQNRQKNDSGVGSIDSNFDQQKYTNNDGQSHYCQLGQMQDSNGYVTHKNITLIN